MDRLSSSEFRKSFARLTERTEVTVNGHLIGTWVPAGTQPSATPQIASEPPAGTSFGGPRDARKPSQRR